MTMLLYKTARGILYLLSLLPFRVIYMISDLLYVIVYRIAGYRRATVRTNLAHSFPEKSRAELRTIEHRFYHAFTDSIVEWFKLLSISPEEMHRRMQFRGIDDIEASIKTHPICFVYLGHFCNWEWISTMPSWFTPGYAGFGQLYHPLRSHFTDWLFLGMRSRFGAENIPKNEALRRILTMRDSGGRYVLGFIADQGPRWVNIHEWIPFLSQDTPVYTGTERIARKVNATAFFASVECPRRGYYVCTLEKMTDDPASLPRFALTNDYMARLEAMIRRHPERWLWTHKRWKRRHEDEPTQFERRNEKEAVGTQSKGV